MTENCITGDIERPQTDRRRTAKDDCGRFGIHVQVVFSDDGPFTKPPPHDHEGGNPPGDVGCLPQDLRDVRERADGGEDRRNGRVADEFNDQLGRRTRVEARPEVVPLTGTHTGHHFVGRCHRVAPVPGVDGAGKARGRPDCHRNVRPAGKVEDVPCEAGACFDLTIDNCHGQEVVCGVAHGEKQRKDVVDVIPDVGIEYQRHGAVWGRHRREGIRPTLAVATGVNGPRWDCRAGLVGTQMGLRNRKSPAE